MLDAPAADPRSRCGGAAPALRAPADGKLDVEFQDVTFGYGGGSGNGRVDILAGLSFKVPAGKSLALVGSAEGIGRPHFFAAA